MATPEIYTLSLHDALPILVRATRVDLSRYIASLEERGRQVMDGQLATLAHDHAVFRSEEHTSELQSRFDLVCRLLLEKKKTIPPCPDVLIPFFSAFRVSLR